ncbi:MbnP family protein [Pedobacter sp. SYSU D00535]|uniref:MbnP family protein n=1 Tax=Pedobacter sp. SYSU D00535 TaxID=2810308 RepID=UPI001A95862E|nr:MbnP family protein [Pedobacter sp. SYSU D00535]
MKLNTLLYLAATLLFGSANLSSCKKDDGGPLKSETGALQIEFENRVGNQALVLNSQTYENANGDDFKVSMFKYYVSNLTFIKDDGTEVLVPESYFLIDAADPATRTPRVDSVPVGDYKAIKLTIGVDSLRNFAGAQDGALDPAKGMFWTWNSGYIFVKFEGSSSKSTAAANKLTFHIGGAKAPHNTIRTVTQTFSSPLRIRKDSEPELHFIVDAGALFRGATTVNFAELNFTMGGAASVLVADNYASRMFRLDHVHN